MNAAGGEVVNGDDEMGGRPLRSARPPDDQAVAGEPRRGGRLGMGSSRHRTVGRVGGGTLGSTVAHVMRQARGLFACRYAATAVEVPVRGELQRWGCDASRGHGRAVSAVSAVHSLRLDSRTPLLVGTAKAYRECTAPSQSGSTLDAEW